MNHDGDGAIASLLWHNILSMILVAALWGCTNPFLAHGAARHNANIPMQQHPDVASKTTLKSTTTLRRWIPTCMHSLLNFGSLSVLAPYVANQVGSIVYYYTLARCNLSVVVPCCNALSLAFTLATSHLLGERVNHPFRAAVGSVLVTLGVAICMMECFPTYSDDDRTTEHSNNAEL